jgi:hypothetical protein
LEPLNPNTYIASESPVEFLRLVADASKVLRGVRAWTHAKRAWPMMLVKINPVSW